MIILLPFLHNAFRLALSHDFLACQQVYTTKPKNTVFQHLDPAKELMPPQTSKTSTDCRLFIFPLKQEQQNSYPTCTEVRLELHPLLVQ
jgi:hypothetical protein